MALSRAVRMIVKRAPRAERGRPRHGAFDPERMAPWPSDDAVSAVQDVMGRWEFVYEVDILRRKRERMEKALWWKRTAGVVRRRAVFVWAFFCPGVGGFAFRGWWVYLLGSTGERIHGGGLKCDLAGKLLDQARRLFPVGLQLPLFGEPSSDDWAEAFARRYQRGLWCGRPQGKAACWAVMRGNTVLRLEAAAVKTMGATA